MDAPKISRTHAGSSDSEGCIVQSESKSDEKDAIDTPSGQSRKGRRILSLVDEEEKALPLAVLSEFPRRPPGPLLDHVSL